MSTRSSFLLGFIACAAAMGVALYVQHVMGLEPCPLCIFQRVVVVALGIIFLFGALHGPKQGGARIYAFMTAIAAVVGMSIAGRQLWLQYMPHEELACGGGLDFMLETMPFNDVLVDVLKGTGECAEIHPLLGVNIAIWTFLGFLLAFAYGLAIFRNNRVKSQWVL